jgi:hypothetical protein
VKRNILIKTESGNYRAISIHGLGSEMEFQADEEDLIKQIDEKKMSADKLVATRFLEFLGNHRLSIAGLKLLPIEEQVRLKKEFLGE